MMRFEKNRYHYFDVSIFGISILLRIDLYKFERNSRQHFHIKITILKMCNPLKFKDDSEILRLYLLDQALI